MKPFNDIFFVTVHDAEDEELSMDTKWKWFLVHL